MTYETGGGILICPICLMMIDDVNDRLFILRSRSDVDDLGDKKGQDTGPYKGP